MVNEKLIAGAGKAEIKLPDSFFPSEGFVTVHDPLHVRVFLLENREKIAVVSIEMTSLSEDVIAAIHEIVSKETGIISDHVLACATHTFSAPHFKPQPMCESEEDLRKNAQLLAALKAALIEACLKAAGSKQPVTFGSGIGQCGISVNRDMLTNEGWWLGSDETGVTDHSVTVLRFDRENGLPLAVLFVYNVQPSVMDGSLLTAGGKAVTGDLAGAASTYIESQFTETTAIFFIGAAGDQAPSLKSKFQYLDKEGNLQIEDIHENGFIISELIGKRLGLEVVNTVRKIACQPLSEPVHFEKHTLRFHSQQWNRDIHSLRPCREYTFLPAGDRDEPLGILKLGNTVLVGVRPELCAVTGLQIKENSPYPVTAVLTMFDGGAKYMPDDSSYERVTYEAMNSPFARGSAELLCENLAQLLRSGK